MKDRRRERRRRLLLASALLLLLALGAFIYALWQPALRVDSVEIQGADTLLPGAEPVALAREAMQGTYLRIVPRDSTLFFPEHRIRASILAAHPEVAAISIAHRGLTGLIVRVSARTAVGRWCGLAPTAGVTPYCYLFDPNGFVYAALPDPLGIEASLVDATSTPEMSSSTPPIAVEPRFPEAATINPFILYAPLEGDRQEPLGATIARASELPDAFNFARKMEARALIIRGDEADIILESGTRLTYVLGREQDAFSALQSAQASLNLKNGSIDYVDLRFPGKVYLKKRQDS